jgi:hypothetical protein
LGSKYTDRRINTQVERVVDGQIKRWKNYRQTDGQTDSRHKGEYRDRQKIDGQQTIRQKRKQTNRQIHRPTDTYTDRQTDRQATR